MQIFFFIPGNKLDKIDSIEKLKISNIIIDLEDAVKFSEREKILNELLKNDYYKNFQIRLPLYSQKNIDTTALDLLISNGFKKFVFPKIQKKEDFEKILLNHKEKKLEIILLVETPRFFIELKEIIFPYRDFIKGIALGSHDFISEIGGEYTLNNLEYARIHILYLARAIDATPIDIASMELKSEKILEEEITDGFRKGYDAKFFIHPWQVQVFHKMKLYDQNDFNWAKKILDALKKVSSEDEFNPVVIDGQVIERPHLNKAKKIIEYYETK